VFQARVSEAMRRQLAQALRRWNKPRAYRARHGLGRGFKQVGGVGLVLPRFLRTPDQYAEFSAREEELLRSLDLAGKTIYDIGAFEGILTMFFATQAGPAGRVVAFEPHPKSFERMLHHLKLNGLTHITVRNIAIGSEYGQLKMISPPGRGRASGDLQIKHGLASSSDTETIEVEVNSLDNEIVLSGLPDPEVVKIDVEGMEFDVLQGMRRTIERCKPALYIEMHGADFAAKQANADRVVELLLELGYRVRHVDTGQLLDTTMAVPVVEGHLYCD
jgi:FkbM family methyltransferase